jgi:hypothetical protein
MRVPNEQLESLVQSAYDTFPTNGSTEDVVALTGAMSVLGKALEGSSPTNAFIDGYVTVRNAPAYSQHVEALGKGARFAYESLISAEAGS